MCIGSDLSTDIEERLEKYERMMDAVNDLKEAAEKDKSEVKAIQEEVAEVSVVYMMVV